MSPFYTPTEMENNNAQLFLFSSNTDM